MTSAATPDRPLMNALRPMRPKLLYGRKAAHHHALADLNVAGELNRRSKVSPRFRPRNHARHANPP